MEPETQLTEDEEYINNLNKDEQIAMLHMLAHAPFIKSSINDEDRKRFRDAARDATFDALLGEGNWKLEKE